MRASHSQPQIPSQSADSIRTRGRAGTRRESLQEHGCWTRGARLTLGACPSCFPTGSRTGSLPSRSRAAHAAEVFAVVTAQHLDALGFCPETEEDMRAELEPPALSAQLLIRDRVAAQWWAVVRDPGDSITRAWIVSDPRLTDAVGDELARVGWSTMLPWISEHARRIRTTCTRFVPDARPAARPHTGISRPPASNTGAPSGTWSAP